MVMKSRCREPASGPDTGKLSMPATNRGSGSEAAGMAAERADAMALVLARSVADRCSASSSVLSKLKGSAA